VLTLPSILDRTIAQHGERTAVLDGERSFTWREFGDRVARAAAVLRDLGVMPGSRFGILAHNGFRTSELMHAGYWLGAVPVPVNYRLAPPEIADQLDDSECRLLAVEPAFAALLIDGPLSDRSTRAVNVGEAESKVPWPDYEALVAGTDPIAPHQPAEDDDALLIYTGGTTGRGKGVRLDHRNILTNALQIAFTFPAHPDSVFLHAAPMFHSADLLGTAYTMAGGAHVFLPAFSGEAVLDAIRTFGITSTMLTPTMAMLTLEVPDRERYDLSSFRQLIYGSSPMSAEWIRATLEAFPRVQIVQGYGLTETSPILTLLSDADHRRALESGDHEILRSAGRAVPGVDLRIVDQAGAVLPSGQSGEIVVRAPNVAAGYLKRPDATAEAFRGGWFHTGDIGTLDARGYLCLLDRKKDMIISGSEIVYSLEVEAALHAHPGVRECAVVGVPDETYGEALLAAVVPEPGERLCDDELIAHCRGRIGGFKIPRHYVFLDQLPKSALNKVLKHELRRLYVEPHQQAGG